MTKEMKKSVEADAEAKYVEEIMKQKKELGIECPKIDKIEIVSYGTVEE